MIDPKELHIGSHIMVGGVRARVIRIDEPMENEIPHCTLLRFKAIVDGEVRDCGGSADSDKVQPIPITAELLEELGFVKEVFDAYIDPKTRFIDAETAKCKAEGKVLVVPRFTIQHINVANPFWSVSAYGKNMEDNKAAVRYLHELEAFLYLTTKTELIKD